jgi:hypothetical protein
MPQQNKPSSAGQIMAGGAGQQAVAVGAEVQGKTSPVGSKFAARETVMSKFAAAVSRMIVTNLLGRAVDEMKAPPPQTAKPGDTVVKTAKKPPSGASGP